MLIDDVRILFLKFFGCYVLILLLILNILGYDELDEYLLVR